MITKYFFSCNTLAEGSPKFIDGTINATIASPIEPAALAAYLIFR